jgi:hypothetical protein
MESSSSVEALHKYFIWSLAMRAHLDGIRPKFSPGRTWHERKKKKAALYMS